MSQTAIPGGGQIISRVATAAIGQYLPVKNDSALNAVVVATAVTDRVEGFTDRSQTNAGSPVPVKVSGFTMALAGTGGWTKGAKLTPTTAGKLIATTTATDLVCAIAQEAASEDEYGQIRIIESADYGSLV